MILAKTICDVKIQHLFYQFLNQKQPYLFILLYFLILKYLFHVNPRSSLKIDIHIFLIFEFMNNKNSTLLYMTECFLNAFFKSGIMSIKFWTIICNKTRYHYQ